MDYDITHYGFSYPPRARQKNIGAIAFNYSSAFLGQAMHEMERASVDINSVPTPTIRESLIKQIEKLEDESLSLKENPLVRPLSGKEKRRERRSKRNKNKNKGLW